MEYTFFDDSVDDELMQEEEVFAPSQMSDERFQSLATTNLNASRGRTAEAITADSDVADRDGLSPELVATMDNREVETTYALQSYHPALRDWMARSYVHAGMIKDSLPEAEEFTRIAVDPFAESREFFSGELMVDATADMLIHEGKLPAGADERTARAAIVKARKHLTAELAVMNVLDQQTGGEWRKWGNEKVAEALSQLGARMGYDFSGVDVQRLQESGVSDTDWGELLNIYGIRDIQNLLERYTPEELHAINDNSPMELQIALYSAVRDAHYDLRGRTTGGKVADAIVTSAPFLAEFALAAATFGGSAAASTGGAAARVGAKGVLKKLTRNFTLQNLKRIGVQEGLRLSAYTPRSYARAVEEMERAPVYYLGADGVEQVLPESQADELGSLIVRHMMSTFIENTSERIGMLMPGMSASRMIPKGVRKRLAAGFLADIAKDRVNRSIVGNFLKDNLPLQGVGAEIMEELAANFAYRAFTAGSYATGTTTFDYDVHTWFPDSEEMGLIAATSAIMSSGGAALRSPSAIYGAYRRSQWLGHHQQMVEAFAKMNLPHRSEGQARKFVSAIRGGDVEVAVSAEDMDTFYQSNPDFLAAVGVTQSDIAEASAAGRNIYLSQNEVMLAQARNNEWREPGDLLMSKAQYTTGITGETFSTEEDAEADNARREKVEELRTAFYTTIATAAKSAGISERDISNFSKAFAVALNYMDENMAHDGGIMDYLSNLTFEMVADPTGFAERTKGATNLNDFAESYGAVVSLFQNKADVSTLIHESGHWLHKMLETLVAEGAASETMIEDLATINTWLDSQTYENEVGSEGYLRERTEFFSRAFEAYFMRDRKNAPSTLERAFASLRKVLRGIYHTVRTLGVKPGAELTQVFDNMFAAENTVNNESPVAKGMQLLNVELSELQGLTKADAKQIQALAEKAKAQTTEAALATMERNLRKMRPIWWGEIQNDMKSIPVYQAWNSIKAEGGLDYDFVSGEYGKATADELHSRGAITHKNKSGKDPATFASAHDYTNLDTMITELLAEPTPAQYMEEQLAKREAEYRESYHLDEEAISTAASVELLDFLIEALQTRRQQPNSHLDKGAMKRAAQNEVSTMQVRDIVSGKKLLKDMTTQARGLVKAINKGDYATALDLALKARRNIEVLRAIGEAQANIRKIENLVKRSAKAPKGKIHSLYGQAIKEVAHFFGFTRSVPDTTDARRKAVATGEVGDVFGETGTPWSDFLFDSTQQRYGDLQYSQFDELGDFARFIVGEGRALTGLEEGSDKQYAEMALSATTKVISRRKAKYDNRGGLSSAAKAAETHTLQASTLIAMADNYVENGANYRYLYEPVIEGQSRAEALAAVTNASLREALIYLHDTTKNMSMEGLPPFVGDGLLYGYDKWTPEMVIAVALNMGNPQNRQRLADGYGWGENAAVIFDDIASRFTSSQWKAFQQIWDALGKGELTEAVKETFLKENHYEFKLVEGEAFEVRTADGATINVEGGYYPLAYLTKTKTMELESGHTPVNLYGKVSSTMARSKGNVSPGVVSLEINALIAHVLSTSQYAAMRLPLRRALTVMMSKQYKDAYGTRLSFEAYNDLLNIYKHLANPHREISDGIDKATRTLKSLLTTGALLGNIGTVVKQGASLTVGANELGAYFGAAVGEAFTHPIRLMTFATDKSAFMKKRSDTMDIDIKSATMKFHENPLEKIRRKTEYAGYFLMKGTDKLVAVIGWNAAYNKKMAELNAQPSTGDYAKRREINERKAVAYADDFVRRTQGSGDTLSMSNWQLSKIGRLATPFMAATTSQYNMTYRTLGRARAGEANTFDTLVALMCNAGLPYLWTSLATAAVAGLFGRDKDDEDWNRIQYAFLRELMSSPFSGIPVLRDVADYASTRVASKITGHPAYQFGSVVDVSVIGTLNDIIRDAGGALENTVDGNFKLAAYQFAKSTGLALRLPVMQVYERTARLLENNNIIPEDIYKPEKSN